MKRGEILVNKKLDSATKSKLAKKNSREYKEFKEFLISKYKPIGL